MGVDSEKSETNQRYKQSTTVEDYWESGNTPAHEVRTATTSFNIV